MDERKEKATVETRPKKWLQEEEKPMLTSPREKRLWVSNRQGRAATALLCAIGPLLAARISHFGRTVWNCRALANGHVLVLHNFLLK